MTTTATQQDAQAKPTKADKLAARIDTLRDTVLEHDMQIGLLTAQVDDLTKTVELIATHLAEPTQADAGTRLADVARTPQSGMKAARKSARDERQAAHSMSNARYGCRKCKWGSYNPDPRAKHDAKDGHETFELAPLA